MFLKYSFHNQNIVPVFIILFSSQFLMVLKSQLLVKVQDMLFGSTENFAAKIFMHDYSVCQVISSNKLDYSLANLVCLLIWIYAESCWLFPNDL